MAKLSDTAANDVDLSYPDNPQVVKAADLTGYKLTLWDARFVNSSYGPCVYVDFTYDHDTYQTLYSVVFSGPDETKGWSGSPAYRQMEVIDAELLRSEGLQVVIVPVGRSFKLVDQDTPEAKTAPKRPEDEATPEPGTATPASTATASRGAATATRPTVPSAPPRRASNPGR